MNERIRELAEQAYTGLETDPVLIIDAQDLEKFALLIVQECANKLATRASYYTSCSSDDPTTADWFSGTANGLKEGIELIQQHFGVESSTN